MADPYKVIKTLIDTKIVYYDWVSVRPSRLASLYLVAVLHGKEKYLKGTRALLEDEGCETI